MHSIWVVDDKYNHFPTALMRLEAFPIHYLLFIIIFNLENSKIFRKILLFSRFINYKIVNKLFLKAERKFLISFRCFSSDLTVVISVKN